MCMNRLITPQEFYTVVKVLVIDALEFINTFQSHSNYMSPREYRKVRVHSHNRIGFTSAAINLYKEFSPCIIVTQPHSIQRIPATYPFVSKKDVFCTNDIDDMVKKLLGRRGFTLGIIDCVEFEKPEEIVKIENVLFLTCKLIVELG